MSGMRFICKTCRYELDSWERECPLCGKVTIVSKPEYERWLIAASKPKVKTPEKAPRIGSLDSFPDESTDRIKIGWPQMDYFFGGEEGGIQRGAVFRITGAPGLGKCVVGDTRLLDPTTGDLLPITEWAQRLRPIVAADTTTMRLSQRSSSAFHAQGKRPVLKVVTSLGRVLRCTDNHPLLTADGWRPAGELGPGSFVATPRAMPWFGTDTMPDHEVRLLAYVIGDGNTDSGVGVTASDPEIVADLHQIAEAYGVHLRAYRKKKGSDTHDYRFGARIAGRAAARSDLAALLREAHAGLGVSWEEWARRAKVSAPLLAQWRRGCCVPSAEELERLAASAGVTPASLGEASRESATSLGPVTKVFERHGLRGLHAAEKFVPPAVMRLAKEQVAIFLRCLFSCDGSVFVSANDQPGLSYSTTSERLARDVQHLLLRFGVITKLRTKISRYKDMPYTSYELVAFGTSIVRHFLAQIGIAGRDEARRKIDAMPDATTPSTHMDMVPTGPAFWDHLRSLDRRGPKKLGADAGVSLQDRRHSRPLTRQTVAALARHTQDPRLTSIACSDVYWDEIVSIEPDGEEEVFDISVPDAANFVANDIVVHNSTLLLQIAAATGAMYLCAEESGPRVATRARRLALKNMDKVHLVIGASMERAKREIQRVKRKLLIVDSLQTFQYIPEDAEDSMDVVDLKTNESYDDAVMIAADFIKIAQANNSAVILVNHLTKEGKAAGKMKVDHLIDGTLELDGDPYDFLRILRASKNRTSGTANVVAPFWMTKRGLIDVPEGDHEAALQKLIDEGMIAPPKAQLQRERAEDAGPPRTFEQFDREADAAAVPREQPTRRRRAVRGRAP